MFNFKLSYRTTFEDIFNYYKSLEDAFLDGSYTFVATFAEDPELKGCALIMLGNPFKGLEILDKHQITTERAQLYRSFAHWCMGKKEKAVSILEEVVQKGNGTPLHHRFLSLLKKERINLLMMSSELNISDFLLSDEFNIKTIGYGKDDNFPIDLDFDGRLLPHLLEEQHFEPDLFLVYRPEYVPIFSNMEKLPFEKIAFLTDFDIHIYQKYPDFTKFDKLVVYSSTEHFEAMKIFNKPTFTFVFSSNPIQFPKGMRKCLKTYDFIYTGSTFLPLFKENGRFLAQLGTVDEKYKILLIKGHFPIERYFELISNSKISFTFVRFQGSFPTRGIEALMVGCVVLSQDRGVMELFFDSQKEYILPYDDGNIQRVFEMAINYFDKVRESEPDSLNLFKKNRSMESFLKFCSFISLFSNKPRQSEVISSVNIKVVGLNGHGRITPGCSRGEMMEGLDRIIQANKKREKNYHTLNNLAIHRVYQYQLTFEFLLEFSSEHHYLIEEALRIFYQAVKLYGERMVLWFNLARTQYHFHDKEKAKEAFLFLLLKEGDELELDELNDDIMSPLFFFGEYFPYREYVDQLMLKLLGRKDTVSPKSIILSGAAFYLAKIFFAEQNLRKAIDYAQESLKYFPSNAFSKMLLVELLSNLIEKQSSDYKRIIQFFEEAVNEYPWLIHPNIIFYVEALQAMEEKKRISEALRNWYLLFKRTRDGEFDVWPIDRHFVKKILKFRNYLPYDARELFLKVDKLFKGEVVSQFTDFEIEVAVRAFKEENKLFELYEILSKDNSFFSHPKFLKCLGDFYVKSKNYKEASLLYAKLLKSKKMESYHYFIDIYKIYNYASEIERQGFLTEAKQLFKTFLKKPYLSKGKNLVGGAHFHLGCIYQRMGETEKARHHFEECLRFIPNHRRAKEEIVKTYR